MRAIIAFVIWALVIITPFAAWVTHILNTIKDEQWILLIVGAFVFPVGVVHGIGIWLGFF